MLFGTEGNRYLITEKNNLRYNEVTWIQNYALWEYDLCEADMPMVRQVNVP